MERLEQFEAALAEVVSGYDRMAAELEALRAAGKTKTVRFRELLGQKLVYGMILEIFRRHGLLGR